jgi:hypothetical protein
MKGTFTFISITKVNVPFDSSGVSRIRDGVRSRCPMSGMIVSARRLRTRLAARNE